MLSARLTSSRMCTYVVLAPPFKSIRKYMLLIIEQWVLSTQASGLLHSTCITLFFGMYGAVRSASTSRLFDYANFRFVYALDLAVLRFTALSDSVYIHTYILVADPTTASVFLNRLSTPVRLKVFSFQSLSAEMVLAVHLFRTLKQSKRYTQRCRIYLLMSMKMRAFHILFEDPELWQPVRVKSQIATYF